MVGAASLRHLGLGRRNERRDGGAGLAAGAALVDYGIGRGDLALMGAVTGVAVGLLQALLLARRGSGAAWWVLVQPPAWALAWIVTTFVITGNVAEQFAVFGASGALVYALLTWPILSLLFRRDGGRTAPSSAVR